jgi:hypothetical protein
MALTVVDNDAFGNLSHHDVLHNLSFEGGPPSRVLTLSLADAGWPHLSTHPGRVQGIGHVSVVQLPD